MTDAVDIQAQMALAEQAAAAGDLPGAEAALRRVLTLQRVSLGPSHPDLANTLNNLAVVCERLEQPAEAERCYRKSLAIARAALPPDHPVVETSAANLKEFCQARGISVEEPAASATSLAPSPPDAGKDLESSATPVPPAMPVAAGRDVASELPPVASQKPSAIRASVIAGIALCGLLAGVMLVRFRTTSRGPQDSGAMTSARTASESPRPAPVAPAPSPSRPNPDAAAVAPPVRPTSHAPPRTPLPAPAVPPEAAPASPHRASASSGVATASVTDTKLCRSLDVHAGWRCDSIGEPAGGGPVFFVTRVKADRNATIEHRWYRNGHLVQSVTLHVPASRDGYRTYSRTTIGAERAGSWRVDVCAADGTVLASSTFAVHH